MTDRKVNELDFRIPGFRDAKVEDYEFNSDDQLVRKDRWERAVNSIRHLVGVDSRRYEIKEVVDAVYELVQQNAGWALIVPQEPDDPVDAPEDGTPVSLMLADGSVLEGAVCSLDATSWTWRGADYTAEAVKWRERTASPAAPEIEGNPSSAKSA